MALFWWMGMFVSSWGCGGCVFLGVGVCRGRACGGIGCVSGVSLVLGGLLAVCGVFGSFCGALLGRSFVASFRRSRAWWCWRGVSLRCVGAAARSVVGWWYGAGVRRSCVCGPVLRAQCVVYLYSADYQRLNPWVSKDGAVRGLYFPPFLPFPPYHCRHKHQRT